MLAAGLSALLYVNALDNPFVYDDFRTVLNNPSIENVWAVRTIVYREMTRPVVNFSYAVDRAIWGEGVFGYHLTSVLLHALNVLLLFQLGRATVDDLPGPVHDHRERQHAGAVPQGARELDRIGAGVERDLDRREVAEREPVDAERRPLGEAADRRAEPAPDPGVPLGPDG